MKHAKLIITAIIALSITSCSKFNQLLKSGDLEKKYSEALRYYYKKDYKRAATLFDNIMPSTVNTARDDTVLFYLGNSYYNTKHYEMGAEMMNAYRTKYSRATFTEEAEYLYAMSFYLLSGNAERDQSNTNQAIVAFNEYLNRYPESAKTEDIHNMIEELTQKLYYKRYLNSTLYYKLEYYLAAITSMRNTLRENPEIPQKEEMMYLICKSWFDYAKGSVEGRKLDRYLKMIDAYYNFRSEYPEESQYDKELNNMLEIAQNYANKYGTQARELEMNMLTIEDRRRKIEENKDLVFRTEDHVRKDELRQEIKDERKAIREVRKVVKVEKRVLRKDTKNDKTQKLRNKDVKKESVSFE